MRPNTHEPYHGACEISAPPVDRPTAITVPISGRHVVGIRDGFLAGVHSPPALVVLLPRARIGLGTDPVERAARGTLDEPIRAVIFRSLPSMGSEHRTHQRRVVRRCQFSAAPAYGARVGRTSSAPRHHGVRRMVRRDQRHRELWASQPIPTSTRRTRPRHRSTADTGRLREGGRRLGPLSRILIVGSAGRVWPSTLFF